MNQDNFALPAEQIMETVASQGWAVVHDFLPYKTLNMLIEEASTLGKNGHLHPAAVGKSKERTINHDIRSDSILWLDEATASPPQRAYFDQLEQLRLAANATMQLGLFDFEGHLAIYPPGAFYQRHVDRFRNDSLRTLTSILYLNPDWQEEDGGQLRMYLDDEHYMDVLPQAGTLVTFLSERYWHEVLPAHRERMSLTGWFKTRGDTLL